VGEKPSRRSLRRSFFQRSGILAAWRMNGRTGGGGWRIEEVNCIEAVEAIVRVVDTWCRIALNTAIVISLFTGAIGNYAQFLRSDWAQSSEAKPRGSPKELVGRGKKDVRRRAASHSKGRGERASRGIRLPVKVCCGTGSQRHGFAPKTPKKAI
jgi:hypothetical protein